MNVRIIAAFLLALPDIAGACWCLTPESAAEGLLDSDVVFLGRAVAVRPARTMSAEDRALGTSEWEFEVLEAWKGVSAGHVAVRTHGSSTFERGRTYFVYAIDRDGELSTSICERTTEFLAGSPSSGQELSGLGLPLPRSLDGSSHASLLEGLASSDPARRVQACRALPLLPDGAARSVPALAAFLRTARDPVEIRSAFKALETFGPAAAAALPQIEDWIARNDPQWSRHAMRLIEFIGPAAAPLAPGLTALLDVEDEQSRLTEQLLATVDFAERERLDERFYWLRARPGAVARALGAMGPAAGQAAIDRLLVDVQDEMYSTDAASALEKLGAGARAAPILLAQIRARPDEARFFMEALHALGPRAVVALPDALTLLKDEDESTRCSAIVLLEAIGPPARDAVPTLDAMLRDSPDEVLERLCIKALAAIATPAAADALAAVSRESEDPIHRALADRLLDELRTRDAAEAGR